MVEKILRRHMALCSLSQNKLATRLLKKFASLRRVRLGVDLSRRLVKIALVGLETLVYKQRIEHIILDQLSISSSTASPLSTARS